MMRTKRTLLLCALLALLLTLPALAHGHHGSGHHGGYQTTQTPVQTEVTVCPYDDCDITGRHTHDSILYCGYTHTGGICDEACRPLCTVEGCKLSGLHIHNGQTCCGNTHDAGFCEGTCSTAARYCRRWCR